MLINPDRVSMLLGIAHPLVDAAVFPNQGIDKAYIFEFFERESTSWTRKLPTKECCMVRVLDIILVHNLLQMMHKTTMSDNRAHLVASLMEGKSTDVLTMMCYTMLQTSIEDDTKRVYHTACLSYRF